MTRPTPPAAPSPGWRHKAGWALLATAAGLLLLDGLAGLVAAVRDAGLLVVLAEEMHCSFDPELGWRNDPGVRLPDLYGPGRAYTTNAQGFRGLEDTRLQVPAGRYRVLCLGDSFTMGYGVDDGDTFPARLQAACPQIQAVNMGLGGYGLDQAYLWYLRDGQQLQADLLLLAAIDADFFRVQRDVFSGYPKPLLQLRDDELVAANTPLPRVWGVRFERRLRGFLRATGLGRALLGSPDRRAARRDPTAAEAEARFDVVERLLDHLYAIRSEQGLPFVLVYLPTRGVLFRDRPTRVARWYADYAQRRGIPLMDFTPVLESLGAQPALDAFLPNRHYAPATNDLLARTLLAWLRETVEEVPEG